MAVKAGEVGDLLGDATKEKQDKETFAAMSQRLYSRLLQQKPTKVHSRDMAAYAVDNKEVTLYEKREANILLYTPRFRTWMDETDETGKRHAYKTPERGRQPFGECTKEELILDIFDKCKQEKSLHDNVRNDIINVKVAYPGIVLVSPDGEQIPSRIWSADDERWFNTILKKEPAD